MLRAARALVGSRWHLLGWLGAALALPVAVWALFGERSLSLAVVVGLQGLALVGLAVISGRSATSERRTRDIDQRLRRIASAVDSLRTDVQRLVQGEAGAAPVADLLGAQRLDAQLRHEEMMTEIGARGDRIEGHTELTVQSVVSENAALINLFAIFDPHDELPAPGGWAASPQTLLRLTTLALDLPEDGLAVECGSGTSTVWLALACRQAGRGRVVALEHDEHYAERTRATLRRLGLDTVAEVRSAPLESIAVGTETHLWYARDAWSDLTGIDVLFVDGPPGHIGPRSRFPAFPLLAPALAPDAVVALDDVVRPNEAAIAADWLAGGGHGVVLQDLDLVGRTQFFGAARAQPAGGTSATSMP
jgi:predicted O-methyltransferase YrrM